MNQNISGDLLDQSNSHEKLTLEDWLREAPFSLSLSSGFFSFFSHLGMISVLEDENLIPNRISGSSAGALIGSLWASGLGTSTLAKEVFALEKEDFWDLDKTLGIHASAFFTQNKRHKIGLLKGDLFRAALERIPPLGTEQTIESCPIELMISAHNRDKKTTQVFHEGKFSDIVYASCAFPILFQPILLKSPKDQEKVYSYNDGGILDRPALAGYDEGDRIFYHHIASKSPWRSKNSKALNHPERNNLTTLSLSDIARSGPTKLALGPAIFEQSREQTQYWLKKKSIFN